ncbi:MAG: hypothetical protein DME22_05280 [Verrucomicrobia bacterium]|nr:MAG: hypothetical protein DME22_05280 [Verrucomicrobiota bacterium]PYJ97285.1 MAG: hypothetical protein DME23_16300 [Verrucomicrobiota bacterium]
MAIWEFRDNELSLSGESARLHRAQYYKDLPEHISDRFDDYEIEFDEITEADERDLKEFFQRLQQGLPLTSSEKLNSVHSNLRDFAKRLAKHNFFRSKVALNDKRYAHFDIVSKVAAIEIEGIDTGLRYDDLKTTFESQASFSTRSNVAQRLRLIFDYLDKVFPNRCDTLRNRTMIQSLATLAGRLITTGKHSGREKDLCQFLTEFSEELSRQMTLGQEATDPDYITFQKTVNSNVRRNAQIRNEIRLRKLLVFDPSFADALGASGIVESAMARGIGDAGKRIQNLISQKNESYARDHGEDLFKPTNKTTKAFSEIGKPIRGYTEYREWLDNLYFIFRESVGMRLDGAWPQSFADINLLRTAERHDVDHGDASKTRSKRKKLGSVFFKYSGNKTPATLAPERFAIVQAKLLADLEEDTKNLKWAKGPVKTAT